VELLEDRLLMTALAVDPTAFEQYALELVNRARAFGSDEVAEANAWVDRKAAEFPGYRDVFDWEGTPGLNEGLSSDPPTITGEPKQPLAFNLNAIHAARDYSEQLLAGNVFGHYEFGHEGVGIATPSARLTDAGVGPMIAVGENLGVSQQSSTYVVDRLSTQDVHFGLFIDNGVVGRGHRINLMSDTYREVGIGLADSTTYNRPGPGDDCCPHAVLVTQDFLTRSGFVFLTGVAFNDTVIDDDFYTPGEAAAGITITATPVGGGAVQSTTTMASGGYSLQLADGQYSVTATGPFGTTSPRLTTIAGRNVKLDVVDGAIVVPSNRSDLGAVNSGIAATDDRIGSGFLMYSEESVFTRFSGNSPHPSNSEHLIAVKYVSGQWYYDDNSALRTFTSTEGDRLLAVVDFSNDTISSLQGHSGQLFGIEAGFADGDLSFFANRWANRFNTGEFQVEGTFFETSTADASPSVLELGAVNSGVAAADDRTGTGFIMYSEEDVFTRFAAHPPHASSSEHLIAVQYTVGQWHYDDNGQLRTFTPNEGDCLLAVVDFSDDTISSMEGHSAQLHDIEAGYFVGDLSYFANRWNNKFNTGEFQADGTFLVENLADASTSVVELGPVHSGVAAADDRTGTGFIMYSEEDVFTRFAAHPPHTSNSEHLIAVKYEGGQWYYDDNVALRAFTPRGTDVLLAEVDFGLDSILSLEGSTDELHGIRRGFLTGDLTFFADRWGAKANDGEFRIDGSFFIA